MHIDKRKVVAIVDGYNSVGKLYAPEFKKNGYRCISVQSTLDIPKVHKDSFFPEDYELNLIYDGKNLQEIIDQLKKSNIFFVVAGSEPGVELADLLSHKIGLPYTNSIALSEARRNKFTMIEALKSKGLKIVDHIQSDRIEEVLLWAQKQNQWPIVLKELKGAGGEGLSFCYNYKEIISSFKKIQKSKDLYGNKNNKVLGESFLDGEQYLVNIVSLDGKHKLSDLWICKKTAISNTKIVLDYLKLLPYEYSLTADLLHYTYAVLDALEIKYGASHNEIMLTKNGFFLIESGARLMGAVDPNVIAQATGASQLDFLMESYVHPELFLKKVDVPYRLNRHLLYKFILSSKSGTIKKINFIQEIKKLRSFERIDLKVKVGSNLVKTKDLFTSPGAIYLAHKNEDVIEEDYQEILLYEKEMFQV